LNQRSLSTQQPCYNNPKGKNLILAKQKHVNKLKKVVKIISAPKNVDSIDMIKEEDTEESHFIEYEDPDDFGALESFNDEFINYEVSRDSNDTIEEDPIGIDIKNEAIDDNFDVKVHIQNYRQ
jgi:hypothetical protein